MRILVVTQYFWPENFRINDLVSGLLERGNSVTVLTGIPNYPEGSFFHGYGFFRKTSQEYHGAKVVRVPLIPRGNGSGVKLALNYLSFVLSVCFLAPFRCREQYDLIFIFEPSPVTVALPALFLKFLHKIPIMFWVQDLWPESLSATGAVTSRRILDVVAGVVRFIYRNCDKILITSRSFRQSIERHDGAPENIIYFPQSAEDIFHPIVETQTLAACNSIPPGFWIMFAGNIGTAQDFQTLIATAEKLKEHRDIHWVIVGDGRMREWAESEVKTRGLNDNFHFLGRHPLETMPAFYSHADALLVTLKKEPIFALTIPAKIQSYLACGRPVIAALDGEGARIVEEAGAGITCPAESADALCNAILKMYKTPKIEREKMGMSGRRYYEANFDRDMLLDKLYQWMKELVADCDRSRPHYANNK
ncbi:glycosyltransferase family 4 protein [Geobacter pickeringii]|uniref:Glycosyltransferase n=1 Tax=Geobacter pickeringii TaxID=345632 RepID=A0A0B5BD67_9BACT|nr:glycosyltransferase family 4 protein [Geobacter pickeringii]AJE03044.1 glycosyltransferase [Geobacter pickeringii]